MRMLMFMCVIVFMFYVDVCPYVFDYAQLLFMCVFCVCLCLCVVDVSCVCVCSRVCLCV